MEEIAAPAAVDDVVGLLGIVVVQVLRQGGITEHEGRQVHRLDQFAGHVDDRLLDVTRCRDQLLGDLADTVERLGQGSVELV